jgi:hypothetical protein
MEETQKTKKWDDIKPRIEETLKADDFQDAFIGVIRRCGKPAMFVYEYQKCIEILMSKGIPTEEEAIEYMEFNVVGAWHGEGTPGFMVRCSMQEILEAAED